MNISLTLHESMIRISPTVRLGESQFNLFLVACKAIGAVYDRRISAQTVGIAAFNNVVDTFRAHGFTPSISPVLFESAKEHGVTSSVRAGLDHLKQLDPDLRAKLFKHQEDGIRFIASRKAGLILDDMGTGKTTQGVCGIGIDKPPVLIVCPAIVKQVWVRHLSEWRKEYEKVEVLFGRNSFRYPAPGEVVITNYDILPDAQRANGRAYRLDEKYGNPFRDTMLIFDEVHRVKGKKGGRGGGGGVARARGAYAISRAVQAAMGRVWGLTGTPLMNHPGDLWNICGIIGVQAEAFTDWPTFLRLFGVDPTKRKNFFRGIPWSAPSPGVAARLERVAIRRTLESVMPNMPPLRMQNLYVDIDKATERLCDEAMRALARMGVSLESAMEASINTKNTGAGFKELARARVALAVAKVPHALEIIEEYEESNTPLLVFCCARAPIDILKERPGWGTITGSVVGQKRQAMIDKMQAGGLKGLGITIKAGGEGITLTGASNSLFIDEDWTPSANRQAIARIRRVGQVNPQMVTRLIANHELDRRIAEILDKKQALIADTVEKMITVIGMPEPNETESVIGSVPVVSPKKIQTQDVRRGPISPVEHWTAQGLLRLSSLDTDRASISNLQGFSATDTDKGNMYAGRLSEYGLTNPEWVEAVRIMMKYQGQVGMMPG